MIWKAKASSVPVVSVDVVIHVRNNRTVPECNATAYSTAGRSTGSQGNVCGCGRKAGQFCNFVSGSGSQPHDMEAGLGWAGLQSIRCQMLDARWQMADGGWQRARGQIGCSTSQALTLTSSPSHGRQELWS